MVLLLFNTRFPALPQDRQYPSNVLTHDLKLVGVLQLLRHRLSAKVEQVPADAIQLRMQIRRLQFSKFGDLHDLFIPPNQAIGYKP